MRAGARAIGLAPGRWNSRIQVFRGASIAESEKRGRGRPRTGIGPVVSLRLYPDMEGKLAAWIAQQPDPKPSRSEAIRRLLAEALDARSHGML